MTWNEALLDGPIAAYEFLGLVDDAKLTKKPVKP